MLKNKNKTINHLLKNENCEIILFWEILHVLIFYNLKGKWKVVKSEVKVWGNRRNFFDHLNKKRLKLKGYNFFKNQEKENKVYRNTYVGRN